jgi:4-hydroxythreonine-4-phosphate dehydrogenase
LTAPRHDTAGPRPIIALAMGDPAGISPELTARLLARDDVKTKARLVVIGDRRVLDDGARVASVALDVKTMPAGADFSSEEERPVCIDLGHLDPASVRRATASAEGGRFALTNYRHALTLACEGHADAVCFTPFNKQAMRLAHPPYDDEISFSAAVTGSDGPASEFNVLDRLWNARVTSHISLAEVAARITEQRVLRALMLTDQSMQAAGFERPRIAVAGLNPHAGDGGNFGREELDAIRPAVESAQAEGVATEGPFPADTVFLRARGGAFDAVLTMYHDQGQIAMKLMGFDRGVTLLGGFAFPICTPAHGTAYEIAGKGIADIGATRAAVLLAAEMASGSMRQIISAAR